MIKGICAATLAVAFAAGCGGGDGPSGNNPPPATVAVTTAADPLRFVPATAKVAAGGTVTWTSAAPAGSGIVHNVKSATNVWPLTSIESGESFSHTFPAAGNFPYECTIHPGMTGVVRVE
jgi:plastocyanin